MIFLLDPVAQPHINPLTIVYKLEFYKVIARECREKRLTVQFNYAVVNSGSDVMHERSVEVASVNLPLLLRIMVGE